MKKIFKITLILMVLLLTILCTKTFATDGRLEYTIDIALPEEGVYTEGQEIIIKFTFNKGIKGVMPKLKIYFGSDSSKTIELETEEITEFTKEVLYKYTIKSGDNGELKTSGFVDSNQYVIEDENGGKSYVGTLWGGFEKIILADTTIEWADFSNATVELKSMDSHRNSGVEVLFKNCTLKSENKYFYHLSHNESEELVVKNDKDLYNNKDIWQGFVSSVTNSASFYNDNLDIFAEQGDVYITVCEIDYDTNVPKIVLKSKKISKFSSLPLTQRIKAWFFDDETDSSCYELYGKTQTNLNYKIGKVTDLNLLNSLKNGEVSALSELMEYAKKAEAIGTGTVKLGKDSTITDKLDLVDDEYYYVYLQLDTVDGKYVEIEDVSLYQALVHEDGGKNLFEMSDEKFQWNLEEENKPQEPEIQPEVQPEQEPEKDTTTATTEIPKAGLEITIALSAIIAISVSIILSKKCKKYEDIK